MFKALFMKIVAIYLFIYEAQIIEQNVLNINIHIVLFTKKFKISDDWSVYYTNVF